MRTLGFIPVVAMALSLIGLPGRAAAVEVGDKAPDFELISTKGGKFKLSEAAGKKNVVVQFYVLDFAPT
jgi:peroxiredoxin